MKSSKGVSLAIIIVAVVGLIVAAAMYVIFNNLQSRVSVILGDGVYDAILANDQKSREKGLGNVASLKDNEALLMAFPSDDEWTIWMKDMKIPIDIVWLNKDKKVIYIVKNASPEGGTATVFTPKSAARYVVELPAGSVDNMQIRIGILAIFNIEEKDVK